LPRFGLAVPFDRPGSLPSLRNPPNLKTKIKMIDEFPLIGIA
jgi:hypothetical protein